MVSGKGKNEIEPTILTVFGATGDLAQRKIYPALFDLYSKGYLPKKFLIIAFGRRDYTNETYRMFVRNAIVAKKLKIDLNSAQTFFNAIHYLKGDFEDVASYAHIGEVFAETDKLFNICSNKLFYLAVPPTLYETILTKIKKSGLAIPCVNGEEWTRILIEKPFGRDIKTARRLDRLLGKMFKETQIFRIDHYLAKETVRNILVFRFFNSLFEPLWNHKHVERIEIHSFEKAVVGNRGALYDGLGALRDVGQNHLLSLLSLVVMEYPKGFNAQEIQKERACAINNIMPLSTSSVCKVVRARYRGYEKEIGVIDGSQTETFFSFKTYLKGSRWRGVPIEFSAGKGLSEDKTEIRVHFRDIHVGKHDATSSCNVLTFRIQPDEGISILFWVKKPGVRETGVYSQMLSFKYADTHKVSTLPDAYEQVLMDAMYGDQTLFASTDEVEAAWKFITPILEKWGKNPLKIYERGARFDDVIENNKSND